MKNRPILKQSGSGGTLHKAKPGRPVGWRTPNPANTHIHIRCTRAKKAVYAKAAAACDQDVTTWILTACDVAVRRQGFETS